MTMYLKSNSDPKPVNFVASVESDQHIFSCKAECQNAPLQCIILDGQIKCTSNGRNLSRQAL